MMKLTKPSRKRFIKLCIAVLLIAIYIAWPGSHSFTVSPETTYITGPLDADGFVDYEAALNAEWGKDIRPEDNATVEILKIVGPNVYGKRIPERYYDLLGMESLPDDGKYYVSSSRYSFREPLVGFRTQDDVEFEQRAQSRLSESFSICLTKPWIRADQPVVWHWLNMNREIMEKIDRAVQCSKMYLPSVGLDSMVGHVVYILQIRATLRIGEHDRDGAWHDLYAIQKLGRLLFNSGAYTTRLHGRRIESDAMDLQMIFLDRFPPSREQALEYRKQLESLPPKSSIVEHYDRTQRIQELWFIQMAIRRGRYLGYENGCMPEVSKNERMSFSARTFTPSVDWDQGMIITNRYFDRVVEGLRIQGRPAKMEFLKKLEDECRSRRLTESDWEYRKWYSSPSSRGTAACDQYVQMSLWSFLGGDFRLKKQVELEDHDNMRIDIQRVAYALAAHRAEHGRYPTSLDTLAPTYIDRIPLDLFTNQRLKYSSDGLSYTLYSVGINGLDDRGQWHTDEPRGDDITIRMPVIPR